MIAAACLLGHKQILILLYGSVEADVMAASITYFAITALSFPFLGIYNAAAALFRSMKKTDVTMYVSLLMNAINVVGNAMNLAIVTVVGQCVGAREYDQAAYYTGKMMKISYFFTTVLGILVCLCLPLIRFFYDVSDETWRYTCILVVMHNALAAALHPTSFNLSNSLRAAGDVKYTMYAGIASMIVFRLGSAVLFAIVLNLGGHRRVDRHGLRLAGKIRCFLAPLPQRKMESLPGNLSIKKEAPMVLPFLLFACHHAHQFVGYIRFFQISDFLGGEL